MTTSQWRPDIEEPDSSGSERKKLIHGCSWNIGKTKGPILRGLAARAPYFHNGSGTTLMDVVNFYNSRFNLGLGRATEDRFGCVSLLPVGTAHRVCGLGLGNVTFGAIVLRTMNRKAGWDSALWGFICGGWLPRIFVIE